MTEVMFHVLHCEKYRGIWKFCGKEQFPQSFAETMRKLCLSTKFPYQEIGGITVLFTVLWSETGTGGHRTYEKGESGLVG